MVEKVSANSFNRKTISLNCARTQFSNLVQIFGDHFLFSQQPTGRVSIVVAGVPMTNVARRP